MTTISALLIVRNEEKNIRGLLDTLRGRVDEIVVVDGRSCDGTIKICEKYDCRVFVVPPKGYPEIDREYGVGLCTGDWVFILDADERPSTFLLDNLKRHLEDTDPRCNGYYIPRRNYYDEHHARYCHGYNYPDLQLRVLRKNAIIDYGGVHRQPRVKGGLGWLFEPCYIMHLAPGMLDLFKPHNKWIGEEVVTSKSRGIIVHLVLAPLSALSFSIGALIRGAYKDGLPGLCGCLLLARYRLVFHTKMALKGV